MASAERIPNAAAAPASAPTVSGAAAAAAPETPSATSTSGKTKSGGNSSGSNNKGNNSGQVQGQSQTQGRHHQGGQHNHQHQHRRKGNKQHQNQIQRQHKGGQYNNNQHHHQNQHQNQHQYQTNRPGAYVPVSARPMTPPALSMQNLPPPLDLAARRSGLLQALTPQLEYYFGPANLAGDTYLRTLMDLNSGYVPVAAVATFGNVQRIVMRWDGGIPPTAATSPNPEDPPGGPLVRSERGGVAAFVAAAAWQSRLLDVVEIDAEGRKVVEAAGSDGKAKDLGEGEAGKEKEKDGSRGNGGKDQSARSFAADARIAIGPVGGGGGSPSKTSATAGGSSAAKGAPRALPSQVAPIQVRSI